MPLHTLFGENILSPSPAAVPIKAKGLELSFNSSAATNSTSGSLDSSPAKNDWLTQCIQTSERQAEEINNRINNDAMPKYGISWRKGNPKILFMGLKGSGKSSIQKVIFENMSPAETLYIETTNQVEHATMESFVRFESVEVPAALPFTSPDFDRETLFGSAGAIIWVLDMQDEYYHSISELISTAIFFLENYPRINFEVFIHKTDGLSEEYRHNTYRDVRQRVQDELSDAGYGGRGVAVYQTSIFDHSVYEAMSKVIQKLLPQLPVMERLLSSLCSKCRIQKAYLFDTMSKIYLATDASPTFLKDYAVCSDYVDMIVDFKQIYGWRTRSRDGALVGDGSNESGAVGESLITAASNGDTYMYAREINDYLSVICVMGPGSTADKRALIDYNVSILHDTLMRVFNLQRPAGGNGLLPAA